MGFLEALLALTLFGTLWWAATFLILFIVICFISEVHEQGFTATIFLFIFALLFYFFGNHTWEGLTQIIWSWSFVGWYFCMGLGYALIRTFFHARKKWREFLEDVKNWKKHNSENYYKTKFKFINELKDNLEGNVFRWWFNWPASLIVWLIKDMLREIWEFLWCKILMGLFNFILDLGIKTIFDDVLDISEGDEYLDN